ncbi:ribosome small subunit-dependent GTPase A [Flexithrix dorotheae]|uniref:ribosome small subunit-dependent GTPase A n=1 Tax=Flexithrix dorotheae TaxID=70993 RepID=UPI000366D0C2|nr:ribosome small subunit-dependent GTPase A [Flexithrix dorotheae]
MDTYSLNNLGWNNFFQQQINEENKGFEIARVAIQNKNNYILFSPNGELQGELSGKIQFTADDPSDLPKVGDWVLIIPFDGEKKAIIHEVLERKTKFSRKLPGSTTTEQIIATNLDLIFLVQGLDHNFNPRRLERYLMLARESGAEPVVILSKADLCENVEEKLKIIGKVAPNTKVFAVSVVSEKGLEEVKNLVHPGKTIAFTGSSGVGKSTLINWIAGEEIMETQEVREDDSRGRHTTTRREMILLENGGILIDTPGMRELQLWNAEEGFEQTFAEIEDLAAACKFQDCTHTVEKGCAVLAALEKGEMDVARYNSFLKLQREMDYLNASQDKKVYLERKRKNKVLHKMIKKLPNKGNR